MTGTNKEFWITIPNVNYPNSLIQRHRGANQQEGSTSCHRWGKCHKIIYLDKKDKKLMAAERGGLSLLQTWALTGFQILRDKS